MSNYENGWYTARSATFLYLVPERFSLVLSADRWHLTPETQRPSLMMISGTQSALAGVVFIYQSFRIAPGLVQLTGYAGFGSFYFLAAGLWLTLRKRRASRAIS